MDNIEIIELNDDVINEEVDNIDVELKDTVNKKDKKSNKKEPNKKYHLWEKLLITFSIIFIICCFIFYGTRLIKYYKIYNPKIDDEKVELLMNAIVRNQTIVYENDGLYRVSGMYVYKGENVNNYIRYSNMLWRIIKFNSDGSLDIVLDDNINMLKWNNEVTNFDNSDIYKYLNNYFYKLLDYSQLSNTVICNDIVSDLNNMTCNDKKTDSYVRLLNISEYLTSKTDSTYINDEENIWLLNRSEDNVWNINNGSLSASGSDNMYYIKPVITIKNSAVLMSGDGTKENPYTISENNLGVGSYVKIDEDVWYIYDKTNDSYKLSLTEKLDKMQIYNQNSTKFDLEDETSLAYYLNNTYYESLSYKDKLMESNWYNGSYNSYEDVLKNSVSSKVGILNVNDIKISNLSEYYLMTPSLNDRIFLYSNTLIDSKPNFLRSIVPTISINNLNTLSGSGTEDDPYVVEV